MKEKEVKILGIDREKLIKKFASMNCKKIKDEIQKNYIYDTPEMFLENKNSYLRLRITEDKTTKKSKCILTFKQLLSRNEFRVNEETEVEVNDFKSMEKILFSMGYKLKHYGEKNRTSFQYKNILWEIDEWNKEFFPYVYVEAEVNSEDKFRSALSDLELENKTITSKSIRELIEEINQS